MHPLPLAAGAARPAGLTRPQAAAGRGWGGLLRYALLLPTTSRDPKTDLRLIATTWPLRSEGVREMWCWLSRGGASCGLSLKGYQNR